jgi:predicted RecA/RadA family phage recombinase
MQLTLLLSTLAAAAAFQSGVPFGSVTASRAPSMLAGSMPAAEGVFSFPKLSAFAWFGGAAASADAKPAPAAAVAASYTARAAAPAVQSFVEAVKAKRLRYYNSAIEKAGKEGRVTEALLLLQVKSIFLNLRGLSGRCELASSYLRAHS